MQRMLVAPLLLQPRDDLLHVLHPVAGRDEHRILGLDDYMILQPDDADQAAFGIQVAAVRVLDEDVAVSHVAPAIALACLV